MLSLTALTERQIVIEQTLIEGGYHRDAFVFRAAWNQAATTALPQLLDDFEPLAERAAAHPLPFVIRAKEPLALAEVIHDAAPEAFLTPSALVACHESLLRAKLVHRALRQEKGGVQ
jgi:hypothetical protein